MLKKVQISKRIIYRNYHLKGSEKKWANNFADKYRKSDTKGRVVVKKRNNKPNFALILSIYIKKGNCVVKNISQKGRALGAR